MRDRTRTRIQALALRLGEVACSRPEAGQALVITALSMFVILGISGFAIDVAQLQLARHRAQVAADAGALAGAHEEQEDSDAATLAQVQSAGDPIAVDNDPNGSPVLSQPSSTEVAATVTQNISLPFAGVFGLSRESVSATAEAQVQPEANADVADGLGVIQSSCNPTSTFYGCEYYGPTVGTGSWQVTPNAETADTAVHNSAGNGSSSVDIQTCGGGITGNTCKNPSGAAVVSGNTGWVVVDLNGDDEGGMYETVATLPGVKYTLGFWDTGNPAGNSGAWDTFTGDVQITNGSSPYTPQYTQSTCSSLSSGQGGQSCECPSSTSALACLWFTHTDSNKGAGNQAVSFDSWSLQFTAQSSETTITFNSGTWQYNTLPYVEYGPEIADITLSYPADTLIK